MSSKKNTNKRKLRKINSLSIDKKCVQKKQKTIKLNKQKKVKCELCCNSYIKGPVLLSNSIYAHQNCYKYLRSLIKISKKILKPFLINIGNFLNDLLSHIKKRIKERSIISYLELHGKETLKIQFILCFIVLFSKLKVDKSTSEFESLCNDGNIEEGIVDRFLGRIY